jgi:hypothetical protein
VPDLGVVQWLNLLFAVVALGVAVAAYRRTYTIKAFDTRLQLRQLLTRNADKCTAVLDAITHGERSRLAVLAATGSSQSGTAVHFQETSKTDRARTTELGEMTSRLADIGSPHDITLLEQRFIEATAIESELDRLSAKYQAALADDDRKRDSIRRAHENRFPQK